MGIINIKYIFTFPDNNQVFIQLRLDDEELLLLNDMPDELPYWTSLDFHQCSNCTLNVEEYPHCPSAIHYVKLLPIFHNIMSYEEVDVKVITAERMTVQKIRAQKAVSSLMGLINATSGCPHTAFFRPMARFHLPFSTAFETTYRATSMYTLAQYFLLKQGQDIDLEFQGLKNIYSNIQMIDEALIARLRFSSDKDVAINALTNLDALAKLVQLSLEESLDEISHLFKQYINRTIENIGTSHRKEQRIKLQIPLYIRHLERHFSTNTMDFSTSGLCIEIPSETSLNIGNVMDVSIADTKVKAEVVWVKRLPEKSLVGLQKVN